ncbi:MAG: hypothetical protein KAV87_09945, partial [Desulfobacteraceae bacterium]|nr:hypothetical protein [Desulfobacteraceae bacterium]
MHLKATEPYNKKAGATADKEIYRQHEGDKRPNPLYDKDGKRKPLDLCNTSHGDLREEWMRTYKHEGGEVIEEKGRICPTCPPIAPCMVEKSITGRFAVTEVKCGDTVGLEADATNIPDGTQTTFTLRKLPEKSAFAKEYDPLSSSKVRGLEWITKKPSNDWPRPEVDFEVTADSETGDSENQFNFHRYPNLPPETETINCRSKNIIIEKKKILSRTIEKKRIVNFAWTGKFDIEFKDGVMV